MTEDKIVVLDHSLTTNKDLNDNKRQFSGIQCVNTAQTEFLWWSLRLPATTTFKVLSVPLENRGAVAENGGCYQCRQCEHS